MLQKKSYLLGGLSGSQQNNGTKTAATDGRMVLIEFEISVLLFYVQIK